MPTEAGVVAAAGAADDIASRRILRLALGTSLSLAFSQAFAWQLSFVAPLFTILLLGMPLPELGLKRGIVLLVALMAPVLIGTYVLIPFLSHMHAVGFLIVALALFFVFHFAARGGPPLVAMLLTIGITINVAIGSVNVDLLAAVTEGIGLGAGVGIGFAWLAHALLPDSPAVRAAAAARAAAAPPKPTPEAALRNALRSLAIVLPVATWFLLSSASAAWVVVMIKVATMGMQAEAASGRAVGRALVESTFWGGVGAVAGWYLIAIWPSLVFYTLLTAIAALVYGRRIFAGPGLSANGSMWSYALLTMLLLLAPALADSVAGTDAAGNFWKRFTLVGIAAAYGAAAVTVFDAFWPARRPGVQVR